MKVVTFWDDLRWSRMTWWRWSASNACNLAPANLLGSLFRPACHALTGFIRGAWLQECNSLQPVHWRWLMIANVHGAQEWTRWARSLWRTVATDKEMRVLRDALWQRELLCQRVDAHLHLIDQFPVLSYHLGLERFLHAVQRPQAFFQHLCHSTCNFKKASNFDLCHHSLQRLPPSQTAHWESAHSRISGTSAWLS